VYHCCTVRETSEVGKEVVIRYQVGAAMSYSISQPVMTLLWRRKAEDVQTVKSDMGQSNKPLISRLTDTLRKLELYSCCQSIAKESRYA
jgi:hypothetical protein